MCLEVLTALGIIYMLCYDSSDKKGRESPAVTTRQVSSNRLNGYICP
jgi:hypothetical protein